MRYLQIVVSYGRTHNASVGIRNHTLWLSCTDTSLGASVRSVSSLHLQSTHAPPLQYIRVDHPTTHKAYRDAGRFLCFCPMRDKTGVGTLS